MEICGVPEAGVAAEDEAALDEADALLAEADALLAEAEPEASLDAADDADASDEALVESSAALEEPSR